MLEDDGNRKPDALANVSSKAKLQLRQRAEVKSGLDIAISLTAGDGYGNAANK